MEYHYAADPKPGWIYGPSADGLVMESHGARIFGRYLTPARYEENQLCPVVILCHGFPGQEQNIDLAQALRRAGFIVIYFWYRGVWGSHGDYSFTHIIEDVATVVDYVKAGKTGLPIDPERIYLFGHSMGGFAVLNALAGGVQVPKAVLMAPCDLGRRYLYDPVACRRLLSSKDNGYFQLSHPNILEEDVTEHAEHWYFPNLIDRLPADISYTFIGGTQDETTPPETNIVPLLTCMQSRQYNVQYYSLDDGHSFHASRIKLAELVASIFCTKEESE